MSLIIIDLEGLWNRIKPELHVQAQLPEKSVRKKAEAKGKS